MKLKIPSDLKSLTAKALACAEDLRRIDELTAKTRAAEPTLRTELESARKRLAAAEIAVELDGATPDGGASEAVKLAVEALNGVAGRLEGLELRRVDTVARFKGLAKEWRRARETFRVSLLQEIDAEMRPVVAHVRQGYMMAAAVQSCLDGTVGLAIELTKLKMPSILDTTEDLFQYQVRKTDTSRRDPEISWVGAHQVEPKALELQAALKEVSEAGALLGQLERTQ